MNVIRLEITRHLAPSVVKKWSEWSPHHKGTSLLIDGGEYGSVYTYQIKGIKLPMYTPKALTEIETVPLASCMAYQVKLEEGQARIFYRIDHDFYLIELSGMTKEMAWDILLAPHALEPARNIANSANSTEWQMEFEGMTEPLLPKSKVDEILEETDRQVGYKRAGRILLENNPGLSLWLTISRDSIIWFRTAR